MIGIGTHVRITTGAPGVAYPEVGSIGVVTFRDSPLAGYAPRYHVSGPVGAERCEWTVNVGAADFEPAIPSEAESALVAVLRSDVARVTAAAREEAMGRAEAEDRVWHLETELRRLAEQLRTVARGLPKTLEVLAEAAEREASAIPERAVVPA